MNEAVVQELSNSGISAFRARGKKTKPPNTLLTKHQAMIRRIPTPPVKFCSEKYSWVKLYPCHSVLPLLFIGHKICSEFSRPRDQGLLLLLCLNFSSPPCSFVLLDLVVNFWDWPGVYIYFVLFCLCVVAPQFCTCSSNQQLFYTE